MTDIKWGAPLTGAQMKLLRDAGLKGRGWQGNQNYLVEYHTFFDNADDYRLPANHPAYTLLNAGWLDGRNVRLWFGGETAPDDLLVGSEVLLEDGEAITSDHMTEWRNDMEGEADIIAYIAKDEARMEVTADTIDPSKVPPVQHIAPQPETITIAKMTPDEIMERFGVPANAHHRSDFGRGRWTMLYDLGLIKETTREERFWAIHEPEGTTIPTHIKKWVKDALEFER